MIRWWRRHRFAAFMRTTLKDAYDEHVDKQFAGGGTGRPMGLIEALEWIMLDDREDA